MMQIKQDIPLYRQYAILFNALGHADSPYWRKYYLDRLQTITDSSFKYETVKVAFNDLFSDTNELMWHCVVKVDGQRLFYDVTVTPDFMADFRISINGDDYTADHFDYTVEECLSAIFDTNLRSRVE